MIGKLIVLTVALALLGDRLRVWKQLSPVEQNLQRAAHGCALAIFGLMDAYMLGPRVVVSTLSSLASEYPLNAWPGAVVVGLVVYGAARFVFGVRSCRGVHDGMMVLRGLAKITAGGGLIWYMAKTFPETISRADYTAQTFLHFGSITSLSDMGCVLVVVAGLWCIITGAVRFVLVVGGSGSAHSAVSVNIAENEWRW